MIEQLHFPFSLSCIGEGNGNPLQCSCLEYPRDRGACWAAVWGRTESDTTEVTEQQFSVSMLSVCLPSDALLQHLPSYLGFSYLGRGESLLSCSSKAQLLFLTLDEGYLLTATLPDLQRGMTPLGPPVPFQPLLLGRGVAPPGCHPWPRT